MDRRERTWLLILIGVALVVNVLTLTPLVPWQQWLLWSGATPEKRYEIEIEKYEFKMLPQGTPLGRGALRVPAGQFVEFVVTSRDVTYGFGVFREDGSMVFQMQVPPGRENRIVWKFDQPGFYDVRSTEYSGPRHSTMYRPGALEVSAAEVSP